MTDGLTLVDGSGNVIMRNTAGAAIAHARSGSDTNVSQYVMTDTSGRELRHDELPHIRIFASEEDVITQDVVLRFVDRSPSRTLSISVRKLPASDGGAPDRAVLVYHDVTADRAQRSALESFAGVVAHDLLGPLSVIDGWAEMLTVELEVSEQLTSDAAAPKLARIRAAAGSMQQLIEDLLASSTSRSQELHATRVDLDSVARTVAAERGDMTTGVRPLIEVDTLPPVHADEAMVRQLLNNLIGNAIKYVRPGDTAEISVRGAAGWGTGSRSRWPTTASGSRPRPGTRSSKPSTGPTRTTGTTGTGSGWPCARTSSSGTAAGSRPWPRWTASAPGWSSRCRRPDDRGVLG